MKANFLLSSLALLPTSAFLPPTALAPVTSLRSTLEDVIEEVVEKPIRRHRRPKKIPLISIVGRPNVGKSALVNRIAGTQSGGAIVADESGITRDRTYRSAEFLGEAFEVVDTGGIVFEDTDALFAKEIREQAMIAIEESVGVVLVVDGMQGLTSMIAIEESVGVVLVVDGMQ